MRRVSDFHWPNKVPLEKLKTVKKIVYQQVLGPKVKKSLKKNLPKHEI